jgi:hypothetical protein
LYIIIFVSSFNSLLPTLVNVMFICSNWARYQYQCLCLHTYVSYIGWHTCTGRNLVMPVASKE